MTTNSNPEPTLSDVLEKLDNLSENVNNLSENMTNLSQDVDNLSQDVDNLSQDVKKFDEKFANYQQATQWVVQLAFTLIASATITIIITAVLK